MTIDLSQLLTVSEASRRSPFSEPVIRAMLAAGAFESVRLGGRIFVVEADLKAKLGNQYCTSYPVIPK